MGADLLEYMVWLASRASLKKYDYFELVVAESRPRASRLLQIATLGARLAMRSAHRLEVGHGDDVARGRAATVVQGNDLVAFLFQSRQQARQHGGGPLM